jgi:hypothetical protein
MVSIVTPNPSLEFTTTTTTTDNNDDNKLGDESKSKSKLVTTTTTTTGNNDENKLEDRSKSKSKTVVSDVSGGMTQLKLAQVKLIRGYECDPNADV